MNHLENKDSSIYGSLMLDYRTNLNSNIKLIYGHSSNSNETPFNKFDRYFDYDFYKDNKLIEIVDEDNICNYEIFSIAKVGKDEYRHLVVRFNNNDDLLNQYKYFKDISIYKNDIDLNIDDDILILQTCDKFSDEFILVIARKVSD